MSKLLIVESPTKARTINSMLGGDYKVLASMGHVRDLPSRELGVNIAEDFKPVYIDTPKGRSIVKELKAAAKVADEIYLAPDPDREGEAIAWHLKEVLTKGTKAPFFRVTFHEITKSAIERAMNEKSEINLNLVDAQQARRVLDRIVGYKVSPLLWSQIEKGSSAGRVQSVALRLVVEREREILNFKPEEYWTFSVVFQTENGGKFTSKLFKINSKDFKIKTENDANKLLEAIRLGSLPAVSKINVAERKRNAPPPFTTSTLQQAANVRFHYSASNTMRYAQQLYEGVELGAKNSVGLITYMRTDSVNIANEAQVAAKKFICQNYGEKFAPSAFNKFKNKSSAQQAHEAIRPTDVNRTPEMMAQYLDSTQLKLYTLIWQRFVASQMSQERSQITTLDVDINGSDKNIYTFRTNTSIPIFAGFTKVYEDNKVEKEDAKVIEVLKAAKENDPLKIVDFENKQKFTEPPPRFSEASLIKELEENGIGRPSTYATVLKTIQDRSYVKRDNGKLLPEELGFSVNDFLVEKMPDLFNTGFTAQMEQQLDEIEEGKHGWTDMLHEFYDKFEPWLKNAKESGAPEKNEAEKLLEIVGNFNFDPPEKQGRRTFDDGKFYNSVKEKFASDGKISAKQYLALVNLLAKYNSQLSPNIQLDAELKGKFEEALKDIQEREEKRSAAIEAAQNSNINFDKLFAEFEKVEFDAPSKKGRFTFDDKKFVDSLRKQYTSGKALSEKQIAALSKSAIKYKDKFVDKSVVDFAPAVEENSVTAETSNEISKKLESLSKVTTWAEPTKKGRFTYDDKEFYNSLRGQFFNGKQLSPRQIAALDKLLKKYSLS